MLVHQWDPSGEFVAQGRADLVLDLQIACGLLTRQDRGEFGGAGLAYFNLLLIDGDRLIGELLRSRVCQRFIVVGICITQDCLLQSLIQRLQVLLVRAS